jgi:hypothetical protein
MEQQQREEPSNGNNNRIQRIRQKAHQLAEERGFEPGAELDDWLQAEQLVDAEIAAENREP